jgi:hypothetical protein
VVGRRGELHLRDVRLKALNMVQIHRHHSDLEVPLWDLGLKFFDILGKQFLLSMPCLHRQEYMKKTSSSGKLSRIEAGLYNI